MEQTVENSKKLWTCAKEPLMNLEKLNKKSSDLAVRDQINLTFCKQLFDFQEKKLNILQAGEELPPDMDQDVPQVLVDMEKNEYKRMFSPYLQLKATPEDLKIAHPGYNIQQISELNLNEKHVLKKNYFILFNITHPQEVQHIGSINSIWKVQKPFHQSMYFIHTTLFQKANKNSYYRMREIRRTPHSTFVNSQNIEAGLNVQHNCNRGECKLLETRIATVERQKSTKKTLELTHTNTDHYIVNLASLSSAPSHRKFSDIVVDSAGPLNWVDAMHDGSKKWGTNVEKKEKRAKNKASTSSKARMDPDLMG
ncbi:hypothetical protein PGTUg99_037473 [Puccinia graminis f. sp. tritici]|uniref:Uncharacterized protein n=1 Tax=Puccinia graminis f. sp. tritici TaxID=56615 RepID=A0A5B0PMR4_PUCGR|nr:hypothetical protein PGTUg99_037473 [Puccinia graminis f. sp. tritici]